MLALGSSSLEDQIALIPDRMECLQELSSPIKSTSGVPVWDMTHFFTGDKPAVLERGTQMGRTYKCGCGCRDTMMDDQAHALRIPWRSLSTLQAVATKGCFGKQPGKPKPFEKLKVAELRKELRARSIFSTDGTKPELQQQLVHELCGVQRVPSLLLLHPQQQLPQLNLQHYTVLDCEPLHDVKGHLSNLFQELPHLVPTQCKDDLQALIKANLSGDKITGADLRATVIYAYLLLTGKGVTGPITQLLYSIINVSQIFYTDDSHRSPRKVLQLRNQVWLHHQLCYSLVTPQDTTRGRFFGIYLHALSRHAADQYEVVCQKSINAEHQERLFGQARRTASTTTN